MTANDERERVAVVKFDRERRLGLTMGQMEAIAGLLADAILADRAEREAAIALAVREACAKQCDDNACSADDANEPLAKNAHMMDVLDLRALDLSQIAPAAAAVSAKLAEYDKAIEELGRLWRHIEELRSAVVTLWEHFGDMDSMAVKDLLPLVRDINIRSAAEEK